MYPRNAASPPRIYVGPVVKISDGAVQTAGVAVSVTPEGGSEDATGNGTIAYSAQGGVWYTPTQAETNYSAFIVEASKASCIPCGVTVVTTNDATAGQVKVGSVVNDAITAAAIANAAIDAATFAAGAINAAAIASDAIEAAKIKDGAITAGKFAAGAIDAAAIAAGAIDAATFAADVDAEIATMVWNAASASYQGAAGFGLLMQDIDTEVDEIHTVVNSIAVTGSALTKEASSFVETINGTNTGTYADTAVQNDVLHTTQADASGDIDCHYVFLVGTSGVPVKVNITGQLLEPTAPMNNTIGLWAWNWTGTPAWELLDTAVFTGTTTATLTAHASTLYARNVETGVGTVKIRFYSTSLDTNAVLKVDQIYVEYAESIAASVALILEDTGTTLDTLIKDVPTVAEFEARTLVAANYFDPAADTVVNVTNVATYTGNTKQTADVATLIATVGAAGIGLTALPQLIGLALKTGTVANVGGTNTVSSFQTDLAGVDNFWNNCLILMVTGPNTGQVKEIKDFTDAGGVVLLDDNLEFTTIPTTGDTFVIINR